MHPTISPVELPEFLVPHIKEFNEFFPDKVEFDHESHSIVLKEKGSFGSQVAKAFFDLVSDVGDVTDNLNLVLADLYAISMEPPLDPAEGERRYTLLIKLFFYELLRIRDAMPRFLARMEDLNIMEKTERHETKKLLEHQLSEHYLIRNVYLHGAEVPRSEREHKLKFIATLHKSGYAPELVPRDGGEVIKYRQLQMTLAAERANGLVKIGTDLTGFVQNIMNYAGIWITHHKLQTNPLPQLET